MTEPKCIVGLGASAGGLGALREFLAHTPRDTGMAFVVVMHLSPDRESHLSELLQSGSEIPVLRVEKETPLQADHVYVLPPNHNLDTIDTMVRLSPLEEDRRNRAPIDRFFRTLAATHGANAVGVVLSGTGTDGSAGLGAIKEAGGLTIVQDPAEADYPGMPQSAIGTKRVDLVLPVAEMPGELVRCMTEPRPDLDVEEGEDVEAPERADLRAVLDLLLDRTGQDFSLYKPSMVLRRFSRRMQIAGTRNLADYLVLLRSNASELERLHLDLLITVTSFFRDPESFEILERETVPEIFQGKKARDDVRVWSIGCATGEEAYSIAILLLERARQQDSPPKAQVFATDLSESALGRAREGVYPGAIEADVSSDRLRRFFVTEAGSAYRVSPKLRESVVFAHHNVLSDPPFAKLDLIVCRNLLIYLKRPVQERLLDILHYALRPGGYLFLGSSETAGDGELFRPVDKDHRIFRRLDVRSEHRSIPKFPIHSLPHHLPAGLPGGPRPRERSFGALHAQLAERHAPSSVLVTKGHKVVHRSENAGRYLRLTGGEPSEELHRQILPELSGELRHVLRAAEEEGRPVSSAPSLVRLDGEPREVALHVRPASASEGDGFLVVSFWELPASEPDPLAPGESTHDRDEGEAEALRERLRSVMREHELHDERMASSNEELQSMNEELRSTTEELETSREELQSMNEELVTINQENKQKVAELTTLTADLQNLLGSTDIATLFLDRDLQIRRFTPRVSELFNILDSDRGRHLSDLTHKLGYDLMTDIRQVLKTLQPAVREVESEEGLWFMVRVMPYRTVEDRIDGAVVTLVEVTELKNAEQRLRKLASELTLAEQRERERIAEVLHDNIQQLLFSVQYKIQMLKADAATEKASAVSEALEGADETIGKAIRATRTLAVEMSPPVLKDEGLRAMLAWLKSHMRDLHELEVELEVTLDDDAELTREQRVLLFQSVRELLFNVVKHAEVKTARIEAFREKGDVVIVVRDGGKGFDSDDVLKSPGMAFGLAALRERLELLDGRMELLSSPGNGTRAMIRMPVG